MSESTSGGRYEVFDFGDDEDFVQKESARIVRKFPKPVEPSPVTKYTFLKLFSKESTPTQKKTDVAPIDVGSSVPQETKIGRKGCMDDIYSRSQNNCPRQNPRSSRPVGYIVEEDEGERTVINSLSASTSGSSQSKSSCIVPSKEFDARGWKSDTRKRKVVVYPDSIMYGNISCTDSILTFKTNTIKLKGPFVDKNKETFCFEWSINILLKIESQWWQDVETAVIKLYFQSEDTVAFSCNGSLGVAVLMFTICDSSWFQGEEAIKLLASKYKALWNVIYEIDSVREENELLRTNSALDTDNCLSEEEACELLVFPKGEPDAVSISRSDIELLQPERFINDTIIDFYMKYLMTRIPHEERNRFYFFNSFFFRKLADLDTGSNNISERKEAFERVRKWTRDVDLFEKDYIFIPVNFSLHWSLIIICHPGELTNIKDDRMDKSSKVTCILHMDSLRGCHGGLKNLFESYLKEELRERLNVSTGVLDLKVSNIQFISLEVPRQQNAFDCGLFLLHYVERFLENPSFTFNPFKRTRSSTSFYRDWFPPAEVSCKRSHILALIHKLLHVDSDNNKEDDHIKLSSTVSPDCYQTKCGSNPEEMSRDIDVSEGKDPSSNESKRTGWLSPAPSLTKQVNAGAKSGSLVKEQAQEVTPELPDNIRHTISRFCSEVVEKFNDRIALYPNRNSRTVSGKENEPSTSYSTNMINLLKSSSSPVAVRLRGSLDPAVVELRDDEPGRQTADLIKGLNNSESNSTSSEDLEDLIVEDSEDEVLNVVSHPSSTTRILPSSSQGKNFVDCVAPDSESEDSSREGISEPEPMYKEKDVINIEDSSKSFKVIDLSKEADDDDANPPVKRRRRNLNR
uniref:Ubiquitin-like protease family profile domain-containing protein n=1 Tax=Kalanchoe fedtschenkoi TaxID=63787 RepID=A0A7N0TW01_KALFE